MNAMDDRLRKEVQRWEQRPGESREQYERRLARAIDASALRLLCAAKAAGWGSSEPFAAADGHLDAIARKYGEFFDYPPQRSQPYRRKIKASVVRAVWDRDGWQCQHCGTHCDLTVDHILPVVHDGDDEMDNLQTLCKSCNSRKGARV